MLECKKGTNFSIVCTSDWLKQQKLTKLHKAVCPYIHPYFPTIFDITKSGLSLNNKEII